MKEFGLYLRALGAKGETGWTVYSRGHCGAQGWRQRASGEATQAVSAREDGMARAAGME